MFKKLKDKLKGDDHSASSLSQGAVQSHQSNNPYHNLQDEQQHNMVPTEQYESPPGPPPDYSSPKPEYAPPLGPPPKQHPGDDAQSRFPQQPAPSWDPPPYHDWTVIPDTALLPPPPSIGYDASPTANASTEDSDRALAWTNANPLWPPQSLTPATHAAIQNGQLALLKAPTYTGDIVRQPHPGHWRCRSHATCRDSTLLTNLPLYSVLHDSPLHTHRPKTIYFELKVTATGRRDPSLGQADAGVAIGFAAPPYPTFRLPGWERGSLAVHGDDGRRYVNDAWGGVECTAAFADGDTLGVGITLSVAAERLPQRGHGWLDVDVWFTRNGEREARWDGMQEMDGRCGGGNAGLRGECDLFPAVGVFGGVDFDLLLHPALWLYGLQGGRR
ncbi:hypothetical protein BDU57DRAFT_282977 [Ampelomyces quisqualis]|uniref:SPRY domain-containing protein n=1 Tax=Ampelomyces quisqualis TaxID=50730 RepID=A0A6A5QJ95_AMPQU|nr:hypothetical protein BDU57DRAFT_282977 [Ampelomyces quisqualis]